MTRIAHSTLTLLVMAGLAAGCASIIGIEDAEVDPALNLDGTGGTAGSGTGGAAGIGGGGTAGAGASSGSGGTAGGAGTGGSAGSAGTTATGGSAGTSGGAGGTAGDAGSGVSCPAYCDLVLANCGSLPQYASRNACLSVCAKLPLGIEGETTGNTVACRMQQAIFAADTGEPGDHCPAAGPGGADVCGSNCEGYCTLMQGFCPSFGTHDECVAICPSLPTVGGYNVSITSGNTIECRLYHVSAASLQASLHCPHADGQDICIP